MAGKTLARLNVVLDAVTDRFDKGLKGASSKAAGFGGKLKKFAGGARLFAGALAAAGGAALAVAVKTGRMADELLDLSEQTGLTTDQLQEYRRVTNQAGVDTDTIARAAEQMTLRMSRGAEGSADLRQGLAELGISAKDAEGNMRPMSQVVDEAIAGLADMDDVTQRNVLATKLFSRGAKDLAPVLGLGSEEIARLRQEAQDMGLVLGEDSLNAANEFRKEMDTLTQSLGVTTSKIGLALMPAFTAVAGFMNETVGPAIQGLAERWGDLTRFSGLFRLKWLEVWLGVQETTLGAVDMVLGAMERMTSFIPILGEKVAAARESFQLWADTAMVATEEKMADIGRAISATTEQIERQTRAVEDNADAQTAAAGVVGKAAQFEEVALLDLTNTIQGTGIAHEDLETVAVGSSSNIEIQAGGAFQRMSSHVSASAFKVLGAVQRVLSKLGGGGGFFGGISGAIGGFLSGGPLGAALGFGGGIGLFAEGGTIPRGEFGIVGEAGPELISGPATVTPMQSGARPIDPSTLPPPPRVVTPDAVAVDTWYRQLIGLQIEDAKARGIL